MRSVPAVEDDPMAQARVAVSRAFNRRSTGTDTIRFVIPAREDALFLALLAIDVIDAPERDPRVTRIVRMAAARLRGAKYVQATAMTRRVAIEVQRHLGSKNAVGARREAESLLDELVQLVLIDSSRAEELRESVVELLATFTPGRAKRGSRRTAHGIVAKLLNVKVNAIQKAIDKARPD